MKPDILEHLNKNKERIITLYQTERKSQLDIAMELHVQPIDIIEYLKANQIQKPPVEKPTPISNRPRKTPLPQGMIRITRAICGTCEYGPVTGSCGCSYYLVTGKRRNCTYDTCDKFIRRKGRKKSREFIVKNTIRLPNRNIPIHEERALHGSPYGDRL